jgi:hypothetical protein
MGADRGVWARAARCFHGGGDYGRRLEAGFRFGQCFSDKDGSNLPH